MINKIDQQLKEIEERNIILELTTKISQEWKGAIEVYDQTLGAVEKIVVGPPKKDFSPFERPVDRIAEINLSTNEVIMRRSFLKERAKVEEFISKLEKELYKKKIVREFILGIA